MDLAELKFVVDTKELEKASTRVAELGTAVSKLNKPMQDLSKESAKNNKELSKAEEAAAKAALAQLKLQQAQEKTSDSIGKSASVLERQNLILEYMAQGNSKGQASILATAKAAGALDDEMIQLNNTLKTQRTLIGGDPFDKSIGLMQKLQNEYKTTNEVSNLFNKNLGLTEKQMIDLAREKERLIALYGIEGRSLDGLSAEYDQLIQKSVMINQANATRNNSMKEQIKAQTDAAKANEYIAKEMERVNRLTASNGDLTSATNNKLIKFEQSLKASGRSAAEVTTQLDAYKAALMATQKAAGNRQIDYLSRALGPQITDIAVGLATGQAPLTILLQQGGQLRDQFALAGVAGSEMGKMLVQATSSMVTSVKDVGLAIGSAFIGAVANSGKAVVKFAMDITGANNALELMRYQIALFEKGSSGPIMRAFLALGSAITFLTGTLIVGAIASLGALAKGFFDAVKEQNALAIQLTLTGASLGVNTAAAIDYAKSLNSVGISTGTAVKVIQEMAKQGGFVASEMQMIIVAANNLKLANVSIEDTVKQFAKLKEKPVEALLEVAKATGMVSPEITKLVYQLSEQGRSSDAAAIAMKAYADVTVKQKDRLKDEMSEFSLFMKGLSSSIGKFYDEVFVGLFRKTAPAEAIKRQIAEVENRIKSGTQASPQTKAANEATLSALKEQLRLVKQATDAESTKLSDQARNAKLYQEFIRDDASFATNQMKRDKELAEAKIRNDELIAAGTITKAQAEKQYQNIRDKYKTPKTEQEKFDENTVKQATEAYLTQIGALDHLTKAEVSLLKLRTDPKWKETPQVIKDQIEALYGAASASEKLVDSEKEAQKALELKNSLLGKADNLGKEYYKTIDLINKYAKEGRFGADEVLQLKAALEATTPEAKRLAAAQAENARVMAGIAAERTGVADQYGGDFKTADEKAAIKNLSDYKKKIAQADAEYEKQIAAATEETTYSEWLMYKEQADAKKALADDVYKREEYLLSDGYKRQQSYATAFEDLFKGMGDAIIDFALTGKTSFSDMVQSMIMGLIKLEMQMAMTNMYKSAGGSAGIISSIASMFTGSPVPSAKGNVFDGGLQAFAKGGTFTNSVVKSPTMFNMGLMGEAGPEAIMPLRRGSDGSLGIAASGGSGGNVSVQVINNSNAQATTNETVDSKGNRKIEVLIGDMTAGEISRSGSASQKSIRSTFGVQPQLIRR